MHAWEAAYHLNGNCLNGQRESSTRLATLGKSVGHIVQRWGSERNLSSFVRKRTMRKKKGSNTYC